MLLNVWGIIWRAQKQIIAATVAGTTPPADLARKAFLASRANAWLSLFPGLAIFMTVMIAGLLVSYVQVIVGGLLTLWSMYKFAVEYHRPAAEAH